MSNQWLYLWCCTVSVSEVTVKITEGWGYLSFVIALLFVWFMQPYSFNNPHVNSFFVREVTERNDWKKV